MPLSCAGTSNVARGRERFHSLQLRDCVGPESSSEVPQRSEQQSEEKKRHRQRKMKTQKATSCLEKTVVFFYPSGWNTRERDVLSRKRAECLLQHEQPLTDSEHPSCWEARHGVTHRTVQVQCMGTCTNHSFCFGLCGVIPFWFLVSYKFQKFQNSKQSQSKPKCFRLLESKNGKGWKGP